MSSNVITQDVVVVIVPFPAQGHLNQLLHLSRCLAARSAIPIHFVAAAVHNRQAQLRAHYHSPPTLHFHNIITDHDLTTTTTTTTTKATPTKIQAQNFPSHFIPIFEATRGLRGPVSALLARLSAQSRRVAVVHDTLMAHAVQDAASLPNTECFAFPSVSAFSVWTFVADITGRPMASGVSVPASTPSLEGCFPAEVSDFMASQSEFEGLSSGYVFNTSRAIEKPYLDALDIVFAAGNKKNWAVGPLNLIEQAVESNKHYNNFKVKRHACLEWLDRQEAPGSVVYVSFGTTTTFGDEQARELGLGLRESGYKFLWVAREADRGDGETKEEESESEMEIGERGVVVRDWAPQPEILAHWAVGGFVSHCRWNSCLEGIAAGVPIGAWPMHSDQPRNAVLVTEVLGVGVAVREWRDRADVARTGAVAEGVRRLMGAAEARKRAAELGRRVRAEVEEAGGASSVKFSDFVAHITRQS